MAVGAQVFNAVFANPIKLITYNEQWLARALRLDPAIEVNRHFFENECAVVLN